jgi:hypothetical protein
MEDITLVKLALAATVTAKASDFVNSSARLSEAVRDDETVTVNKSKSC